MAYDGTLCDFLQASELFDAANQTASEAFAAIRTVAAFSLQAPLVQVYEKLLEKPQAAVAARAHASGLGFGFSQFAVFSVYALAFWYGGQLMRHGEMDFAQVLKVCITSSHPFLQALSLYERCPYSRGLRGLQVI